MMPHQYSVVALVLLIAPLRATGTLCQEQPAFNVEPTEGNPLIGFMPYSYGSATELKTDIKHSLEYSYLALNQVLVGEDTYDWQPLEDLLESASSKLNQLVVRLYLDYPDCCPDGQYNTGVPSFLLQGTDPVQLTSYTNHGGGKNPDYENDRLVDAMLKTISTFGSHYDGDNRLAYVQVGLIGFWGEWHTWPKSAWMPSRHVQQQVLEAFDEAFDKTLLVVSQDELDQWSLGDDSATTNFDIGWHDDNFCVGTYSESSPEDWFFYDKLKDRQGLNRWKSVAIGGEVQPSIQTSLLRDGWDGQNYQSAIDTLHVSWLLNYRAFGKTLKDSNSNELSNARAMHLSLGYKLHVVAIEVGAVDDQEATSVCAKSLCATVSVTLSNSGIAPFYHPLSLRVTAFGDSKVVQVDTARAVGAQEVLTVTLIGSPGVVDKTITCQLESGAVLKPITLANQGASQGGLSVTCPDVDYTSTPSHTGGDVSDDGSMDASADSSAQDAGHAGSGSGSGSASGSAGDDTSTIAGDDTSTVAGDDTSTVAGDDTSTVAGDDTSTVAGSGVNTNPTQHHNSASHATPYLLGTFCCVMAVVFTRLK